MKTRRVSSKPLRLRELREERGFSQYGLAEESGVGRSTIAALEAGERGAHPNTVHALAGALGVTVLDLYKPRTTPQPRHDRPTQTAHSYARLRQSLSDAFPGVENEVRPGTNGRTVHGGVRVAAKEVLPVQHHPPPHDTFGARSTGVGGRLLQVSDRATGLAYGGARIRVGGITEWWGEGPGRTLTVADRGYTGPFPRNRLKGPMSEPNA